MVKPISYVDIELKLEPEQTQKTSPIQEQPVPQPVPKYAYDKQRVEELKSAIMRYLNADLQVPTQWIVEYNSLLVGHMKL